MRWRGDGWLKGTRWVFSPNQGERPADSVVSLIVLHSISLPPDDFSGNWIERFFLNRLDPEAHPYFATIADLRVSAHFLIRRDGRVIQFVACDRRAWHAGQSAWRGRENCNDYAVGIELEGSDNQPFSAAQYETLWKVIDALRARYPVTAIAGHCHVAPERKTDPGLFFDWPALAGRYPALGPASEEAT